MVLGMKDAVEEDFNLNPTKKDRQAAKKKLVDFSESIRSAPEGWDDKPYRYACGHRAEVGGRYVVKFVPCRACFFNAGGLETLKITHPASLAIWDLSKKVFLTGDMVDSMTALMMQAGFYSTVGEESQDGHEVWKGTCKPEWRSHILELLWSGILRIAEMPEDLWGHF